MAPFEFMYGRKCRTPLNWSEVGESQIFGPGILREAEEKVHKIREHLNTAQSRQKSYADKRRRDLAFNIPDFVYLKFSPLKVMQRFQLKGKLPVKTTYQSLKLAELYIARIVSFHGVPKNIVSDRGTQFTSRFWKKVQEGLGT